MKVEILAVGTELLLGQIVNSNAAEIGMRLAESGLDHHQQTVVGDNLDRIVAAIEGACGRAGALIITGGIGPTKDDLTREAICAAAGVEMRFDEEYAERLRAFWESRGREMPASNLQQAEYPDGAVTIRNAKGTAPGLRIRIGDTWVFALPGVPAEMLPMLESDVLPFLRAEAGEGAVVASRLIRTWGESESKVGETLADIYDESVNPTIAFLASSGEIKVRITAKAETEEAAAALIAPVEAEVRRRLGSLVFAADEETIEALLLRLLEERGWTIATAESATGGIVAARLTSVAGASAVFRGGIVAYDAARKERLLGVPGELVVEHGVVSPQVAEAMAVGAATLLGVNVAIGITGAAGPETHGGREVGTVVIAVRTPDGIRSQTLKLPGDRERVRTYASTAALHLARLSLQGRDWGR